VFSFAIAGFFYGLITTFGSLVGVALGGFGASLYFKDLAEVIKPLILNNLNLAKVISFVILYVIINRLTVFAFYIINKIFRLLTIIPFLKTINHIGGAVLGFLEGVFGIGILLVLLLNFPLANFIDDAILNSQIAQYLIAAGNLLKPIVNSIL
jgi:uncharacterized membrane protein required for colicin V production